MMVIRVALTVMLAALSLASASARSNDAGPPAATRRDGATATQDWRFSLRPYFFLSGMSGSVTVDQFTVPLNSSFADLLDNVKLGGFVNVTAEKGQWGVNADFEYIELHAEGRGYTDTHLELKNVIGEADVVYRPRQAPTLRFLVGVRVYALTQNVRLLGEDLREIATTVADPILGAVGSWALHDRWDFELRGDIGGFGIGSESTYQLMAAFRWGISETASIPLGYRVLGYQIQKDEVLTQTRMSGLMLGADFRF